MNRKLKIKIFILLALVAAAALSVCVAWGEERKGVLTVAFLNVGQGDAILTV